MGEFEEEVTVKGDRNQVTVKEERDDRHRETGQGHQRHARTKKRDLSCSQSLLPDSEAVCVCMCVCVCQHMAHSVYVCVYACVSTWQHPPTMWVCGCVYMWCLMKVQSV